MNFIFIVIFAKLLVKMDFIFKNNKVQNKIKYIYIKIDFIDLARSPTGFERYNNKVQKNLLIKNLDVIIEVKMYFLFYIYLET